MPEIEEKVKVHTLFKLMVVNDEQLPIKMYTELDFNFQGLQVSNVGVLILEDSNQVLNRTQQLMLPGILGLNLIQLSYNAFVKKLWDIRV